MNELERAEDHLRVIRSLMERATIYRAISAPTALVAGVASVVASLAICFWLKRHPTLGPGGFMWTWTAVLIVALNANTLFITRGANRRGEPVISSGMKLALRALLPSILAAIALTVVIGLGSGNEFYLSLSWIIFYGLGLLSTGQFAPRSIAALGWCFLLTGLSCALIFTFERQWDFASFTARNHQWFGACAMGATFGCFHVVYAACTWPRRDGRVM